MENKLKNKEADKQQEKGKTMSSYKKALRVILLLFAGMLIGQYIECYSCQPDVDTGYDKRITNSIEKSMIEVVREKDVIDGIKVDETKTQGLDSIGLYRKGKKWGFYNMNTDKVLVRNSIGEPKEYDNVGFFSEGLAAVLQDRKIGFVDIEGNLLIPFQYLSRTNKDMKAIGFHNGYCRMAGRDGRLGVIDKKGRWVIKPIYTALSLTATCIFASTTTSRVQLNYDGALMQSDLIVRVEPLKCSDSSTGYNVYYVCDAENNERCGLMDNTGKRLTAPVFRRVEALSHELFKCYFRDGITMEVLHFPAIEKKQ